MKSTLYSVVTAVLLLSQTAVAQKPPKNTVAQALEEEVSRAMTVLKQKGNPPPYFINYEVNDIKTVQIDASLGALKNSDTEHSRLLDIDVRVGDYQYDNTHQIRGQRGGGGSNFVYPVMIPLDDDLDALKSAIW